MSDATTAHHVTGTLAEDDTEVARLVQILACNGIVALRGMAYNGTDEAKVLRDASSVEGVVKVEGRLIIRNDTRAITLF